MTRRRDLRRHAATQQRLRWEWRQQAWGIYSTFAKGLKEPWGGGWVDYYVGVQEDDWHEPLDLIGCDSVQLRFPSPARITNMAAFRAAWDARMGSSWRWEFIPEEGGWLFGHPYDLPTSLAYPPVNHQRSDLVDVVPLGYAEDDSVLVHDLNAAPHGMIGGKTQRGKSSMLLEYAMHLLATGRLQAFVVLDPKGGQYPALKVPAGHPAAWNPDRCTGIHVAEPTWDAAGHLVDFHELAAAAEAMDRETGRRRIHSQNSVAHVEPSWYRQARVVGVYDEIHDLLARDPKPDTKDDSDGADRARARNRQRDEIERALCYQVQMAGGFGMTVLPAAQSPRRDTVPGVIHANTAHKLYLGGGDSTELGILFGKRAEEAPSSPLDLPGRGVWLNNRIGAPPTDPYLAFQAFLPDLDRLARLVEEFTPATLPTVIGSPNGHAAHLPSM